MCHVCTLWLVPGTLACGIPLPGEVVVEMQSTWAGELMITLSSLISYLFLLNKNVMKEDREFVLSPFPRLI